MAAQRTPIPSAQEICGPAEVRNGNGETPRLSRNDSTVSRSPGSRSNPNSIPPPPAPQSFAPDTHLRNSGEEDALSTFLVEIPRAVVLRIAHSRAMARPARSISPADPAPPA